MRNIGVMRVILLVLAASVAGSPGCGKTGGRDLGGEKIATVNGDAIEVRELREFLGIPAGIMPAKDVPVEKKKEALDRLISGRLLVQEARGKGLDNTDGFRKAIERNGQSILITALLRREIETVKASESDIRAEAKKLRAADNTLSEEQAQARAGRVIAETGIRKLESSLIAASRKDFPASIDREKINKISAGQNMPDGEVLAVVGNDRISYGQAKAMLQEVSGGPHGGQDLSRNPIAIGKVLDREITGRALTAYARKQGMEGTEQAKKARRDLERTVLIELLADSLAAGEIAVTEKEILATYAEHGQMFVQNGKKIPLSGVRDQIKRYLQNVKRRKIFDTLLDGLKKKATIEVKEDLIPKV